MTKLKPTIRKGHKTFILILASLNIILFLVGAFGVPVVGQLAFAGTAFVFAYMFALIYLAVEQTNQIAVVTANALADEEEEEGEVAP